MTGNGGGPGILYWPTAKAFVALGRPVPDHPAYRYDLVGATAPSERPRVRRARKARRDAHRATQGPQNGNEGTRAS